MKVSKEVNILQSTKYTSLVSRGFENNGVKGEWTYATRRKVIRGHLAPAKDGLVGVPESLGEDTRAVIIIAMVKAKGGGIDYILNKEFRVPLVGDRKSGECYEISFPAGLMDGDETPEKAAIRELAEETPYEVVKVLDVSPPLASSSGITDELIYIVRCVAKEKADKSTSREASEEIETFLASNSDDPRIPKGDDIVWGVRAWMELSLMTRIMSSSAS
jgi:8-oxo-dGTP pyrophosphatase MutT (NUDIX family)